MFLVPNEKSWGFAFKGIFTLMRSAVAHSVVKIEGSLARASCCVLEQDTLSSALDQQRKHPNMTKIFLTGM